MKIAGLEEGATPDTLPRHLRNYLLRILLLADTHLGFDEPRRPRVQRRRRGPAG